MAIVRSFLIDNKIHPSKVIKDYRPGAKSENQHYQGLTQDEDEEEVSFFQDSRDYMNEADQNIQTQAPPQARPSTKPKPRSGALKPQPKATIDEHLAAIMEKLNSNSNQLTELINVKKQVGANSEKIAKIESQAVANKIAIQNIQNATSVGQTSSTSTSRPGKSIEKLRLKRRIEIRQYFCRKGALQRNGTLLFKVFKDAPAEYLKNDNLEIEKFHINIEPVLIALGLDPQRTNTYACTPGRTKGGLNNDGSAAQLKIDCNLGDIEMNRRAHSDVDLASYLISNRMTFQSIIIQRTLDFVDAAALDVFNSWRFDLKLFAKGSVNKYGKYTIQFNENAEGPSDHINVRCPLNLAGLENPTKERIKMANLNENWVHRGEIVTLGDDTTYQRRATGNRY